MTMKSKDIIPVIVGIIYSILLSPLQLNANEEIIDTVVITEDGDSIIKYRPNYYDFGEPNTGVYNIQGRMMAGSSLAMGKDMDALRLEAFNRDLQRLQSIVSSEVTKSESDVLDKTRQVWKIPVNEGTTPSGARTYSVPINVPSSLDLAPQISLVYNSQSGQGIAGYGWSISGLSEINIVNKTKYYNGKVQQANYKDTDAAYALDGMPLVKNGGTVLQDEYQLETAKGYVLVKKHVSDGKVTHFTVLYPDGSRAVFGQDGYTASMRYTYPITEIEDIRGNKILFKYLPYQQSTGYKYYISSIEYGFIGDKPEAKIQFNYSFENNSHSKYYAGIETKFKYILKSISSYNGSEELCRYELTHEVDDYEYMLTAIECKTGDNALNPLRFCYGEDNGFISESDSQDLIYKDQLFLATFFNTGGEVDVVFRSGKFIEGTYGDGLIAFPNFANYGTVGKIKKWFLGKGHDLYGSTYSPDQKILIAPFMAYYSDVQSITAGEGFQYIDAVDTDADGIDEIVKVNFAGIEGGSTILNITVYEFDSSMTLVTKSSFNVSVDGVVNNGDIAYSPAQRVYAFGNFKSNGKAMLMTTLYNTDFNSSGRTPYTALIDINGKRKVSEAYVVDLARSVNEQNMLSIDVDGDGQTEMCWATPAGLDVYNLSDGKFTKTKTISGLTSSQFPRLNEKDKGTYVADVNGDGYPDFIYRSGGNYYMYIYTGNEYIMRGVQLPAPAENDELMFYDINRDGLSDLIHRSGPKLYLYINQKGTISELGYIESAVSLSDNSKFLPCNSQYYNRLSSFVAIDGAYVKTYGFTQDRAKDRLLTTFMDSHGVTTVNEYADMSASYYVYGFDKDIDYGAGFGKNNYPMYLLYNTRTYTSPELTSGKLLASKYFKYYDAVCSWEGLGFCGFGKVETTDLMTETNKEVVTSLTYDPSLFGVLTSSSVAFLTSMESPFNTTNNTYSTRFDTYRKMSARLVSSININHLSGVTTDTEYSYTDYDLPSSVTVSKTTDRVVSMIQIPNSSISRPVKDKVTENKAYTYRNHISGTCYLLGQVMSQKVVKTRQDGEQWVELQTYEYDEELMLPVNKTDYVGKDGDQKLLETRWTYDDFGHVTSERTARYNSTAFFGNSYTYDSKGRYLLSRTDAMGISEIYSGYNKFGRPETVTDHKGRKTKIVYDEWGNEISRIYPEGTEDRTSVDWGGIGLYTETRSITGKPTEVTHYDAAGRILRTGVIRFDGTWLYTDNIYDSKGRLEKVSLPFKGQSASSWDNYEYDEYNRKTKQVGASGNIVSWSYDKWKISETRNGITTVQTLYPDELVAEIEDTSGRVVYIYRADGQLSEAGRPDAKMYFQGGNVAVQNCNVEIIDSDLLSNFQYGAIVVDSMITGKVAEREKIYFEYDDLGRKVSIVDPSAGRQTYSETWSADGSSYVTHINPNGTIIVRRDRFGRIVEVERQGEYTTSYNYNSDGLLTDEISTNGTSKTYIYDSFDRLETEKETVPDGKWLSKTYTYTSGSRIATKKYVSQSGEITTEVYTYANGYNTSVSIVDGYTVWALTQENNMGLPLKAMTGLVERTYQYAVSGQPTGRTMGNIQQFGYTFSPQTGNLLSRTDRIRNKTELFGYDGLNRLINNDGKTITYSNNGNITSMESVGEFGYTNGIRPYQITEVSLSEGNVFRDREQTISYTCYSRPSRLNEGGRSASFTYNGNNERVKMYVADGTSAVLTRYYIGNQYELDITAGETIERLYLNGTAYSSPMVLIRKGDSGWIPYNIGRDYLGSITHIATADGVLVAEYSYDAWGRLRNPETHEIYLPGQEPELFLGRGFTGHEHLSWFGLINMNARLYDPVIGRFLSPDPYIQAPYFSQNFNRYSYCLNNPLCYVDENGEAWWVVPVALAAIFAIGNTISHAIDNNIGNFGEGLKYFFQGALTGFALGCLWQFSPLIPFIGPAVQATMTYYGMAQGALSIAGTIAGEIAGGEQGYINAAKIFLGNFNLDENSFFGGVLQGFSRHSWEFPQTFIGAGWSYIRNSIGNVDRVDYLAGATFATNENSSNYMGVTLGNYINMDIWGQITGDFDYYATNIDFMYMHEYGHTIDSMKLGLAYLLVIGLPSAISASKDGNVPGYNHDFYWTEIRANKNASRYFSKWYDVIWKEENYPIAK